MQVVHVCSHCMHRETWYTIHILSHTKILFVYYEDVKTQLHKEIYSEVVNHDHCACKYLEVHHEMCTKI